PRPLDLVECPVDLTHEGLVQPILAGLEVQDPDRADMFELDHGLLFPSTSSIADLTIPATISAESVSGSVFRSVRLSVMAPSKVESPKTASRRATVRLIPPSRNASVSVVSQDSNTSAQTRRNASVVLAASSATAAIGQPSAKSEASNAAALRTKNCRNASEGS